MNKQEPKNKAWALKKIDEKIEEAQLLKSAEYNEGYEDGCQFSQRVIDMMDEPQKPVVPKFVAEWIEYAKKKGDSLAISFKPWNLYGVEYSKADRWIDANQETFARAWLNGYEVEKEPLYVIKKDNGYISYVNLGLHSYERNCTGDKELAIKLKKEQAEAFAVVFGGEVVKK